MKTLTTFMLVLVCFSTSGCLSNYRENQRAIAERQAIRLAKEFENNCKDYGHKDGTTAMATCIGEEKRAWRSEQIAKEQLRQQQRARSEANSRAFDKWLNEPLIDCC